MRSLRYVAASLALVLALSPVASADAVSRSVDQLTSSTQDAADALAGAVLGSATGLADALSSSVRPLTNAAGSAASSVLGSVGGPGAKPWFFATGAGAVAVDYEPTCDGMQATVSFHDPYSNEPDLVVNFGAGQGSSAMVCSSGWRFAFKPTEVQGDAGHGWTAERHSPDADIWLVLGPAAADGARPLWVHQHTILNNVLEFQGSVAQWS